MKPSHLLTVQQFSNLHQVNKRTLHYYDTIGLFSPTQKGENGYRYYDTTQSVHFEYIQFLKGLGLSLDEIRTYLQQPNAQDFLKLADEKLGELARQIEQLQRQCEILQLKKEQVEKSLHPVEEKIQIVDCQEDAIVLLEVRQGLEDTEFFKKIKEHFSMEQLPLGIGTVISLDGVRQQGINSHEGFFFRCFEETIPSTSLRKPKGRYLCGYHRGTWEGIPAVYERMLHFAKEHHLQLGAYAYERGLNEFVIEREEEYLTEVMIPILEEKVED